MDKSFIRRTLILLTLLFGVMSAASAADRFYVESANFEPGETRQVAFVLDNTQEYFGFQADIELPEGLEFVTSNGKVDIKLSGRADASFSTVSNLTAEGVLRVGAFSTGHVAFTGNDGALFSVNVRASDTFNGGILNIRNIILVNSNDTDIELPDESIELGTHHVDSFYIPDFKIAVGETKTVSIVLDNETTFSAFQTDVYLPEGLTIADNSCRLTSRGADHTVSAKSFPDGRTRIICMSLNNKVFSGNSGALLELDITANKDVAETATIELKNQVFSMANAKEYVIPNSQTLVTTERALVESITLSSPTLDLIVGESQTVVATVLPEFASTKDVEWKSDNPEIATVSADGKVTAVGVGSATITVSAVDGSNVSAECKVTVQGIPLTNIVLSQTTASLKVGESVNLSITPVPENAYDTSMEWKSADETIATVDGEGRVTALALGETVITATSVFDPTISADCVIKVVPTPVTEISLNEGKVALKVGGTFAFQATVSPESATDSSITWSSEDNAIATIDDEGVVTAVSLGSTTITATAADGSGVKATAIVEVVTTPAEKVEITPPATTEFKVGQTITLTPNVYPENATDKSVSWTSSDTAIATVNADGEVTAVGVGTVVITAKDTAGNSTEITLTVLPTFAESISVDPTTLEMKVKDEYTLTVTVLPETTTDKSLTFDSADESVATVDANGKISAVAPGVATITVTCGDVSAKCTVTVSEVIIPVESIALDCSSKELQEEETFKLAVTLLPETATDKTVTWSSSDESVATVDNEGTVTAVKPGEATITAKTSNGLEATCKVTVIAKVIEAEGIVMNMPTAEVTEGENVKLAVEFSPEDTSDKTVTWASSDEAVATVDNEGTVTAVKPGVATITAKTSNGLEATCKLTVIAKVIEAEGIVMNMPTAEVTEGETVKLSVEFSPENTSDKTVTWASSDEAVATVDNDGTVTAVKPGEATITAKTSNGLETTCKVTVIAKVIEAEGIVMNMPTAEVTEGETVKLAVEFSPENTSDKTVTWSSSDESIASVDNDGTVTAIKPGEATITAKTSNGLEATCKVTVIAKVIEAEGIVMNMPEAKINKGETMQLTATILPEETTDKNVEWSSSDETVATVDGSGLVTALKKGTAVISATSSNGLTATCTVTVEEKSGIEDVRDGKQIEVTVRDGALLVGAPEGAEVEVYNMRGVCVERTQDHRIDRLPNGVYVVRVGDKSFKVKV